MPYEPLEAILERMKADSVFRTELMAKEDVAERMELIISEMLCCALEEMNQPGFDSVESEMDKGFDAMAAIGLKGSSPQSCGYAHPSKAIEKRFK
ncbi:MAG: bacteriochlorophyll c-binding family protein [Chlorobium sp.]|nr:MAG: hypothetical protein FDX17_11990 [Chlorobium sp.]